MNVHLSARRFGALLAMLGLIGLVLVLVLPSVGVNLFGASAGTPPSPPTACTTSVVYYANSAPKGSNNFGPTQSVPKTSHATAAQKKALANSAYDRLISKMDGCVANPKAKNAKGDTLFTAETAAYFAHGVNLDAANAEAMGNTYAGNKSSWTTAVKGLKAQVVSYKAIYDPNKYQTLGMVPNGSKQPSLIRSSQNVQVGWALVVKLKNGTEREFRIICDLQPVGHFPHVPTTPVPPAPPTHKPPTPTHSVCPLKPKPGYEVTRECTYYKPPQSFNCQQNGGPNCPPNHARQPVQSPGNGVQATATNPVPGVSTEPQPLPSGPHRGQAPPTTSAPSGYNPGPSGAPGGGSSNGGSTTVRQPNTSPTPGQGVPSTDPVNGPGTPGQPG